MAEGWIYAVRSDDGGDEQQDHSVKCGFTTDTNIDVWLHNNYARVLVPLIVVAKLNIAEPRAAECAMHRMLRIVRKDPRHEVFYTTDAAIRDVFDNVQRCKAITTTYGVPLPLVLSLTGVGPSGQTVDTSVVGPYILTKPKDSYRPPVIKCDVCQKTYTSRSNYNAHTRRGCTASAFTRL